MTTVIKITGPISGKSIVNFIRHAFTQLSLGANFEVELVDTPVEVVDINGNIIQE